MVQILHIFGVTGSIGDSCTDIVLSDPDRFQVDVVSAYSNVNKLAERAIALKAKLAVIADDKYYDALKEALSATGIAVQAGGGALNDAAARPADLSVAAIMGMAGLEPLMNMLKHSQCVAIANKEPLVSAGALVKKVAADHQTTLLPLDSEHNAIFQVFENRNRDQIKRLILTASGGPFRTWSANQIASASLQDALKHPNWSMGDKITIDSATLMNKGLEVIEAHHLFGFNGDKIDVIIHPQSIIHSMVEYSDGSILSQMGASDMRTPIAYALSWPQRMQTPGETIDLSLLKQLDFEEPDFDKFPALKLAYECLEQGQGACLTLNAANEIAVGAFLEQRIGFGEIIHYVKHALEGIDFQKSYDGLEEIIAQDKIVRTFTSQAIERSALSRAASH